MGIIFKEVPETELYSAYGLIIYGKVNTYEWTIYGTSEDCYVSVRISNGNEDLFSEQYWNTAPTKGVFDRYKDDFLWWISRENPDKLTISETFNKAVIHNDCLFSYRIQQRKFKEREEAEQKRYTEELKAKEEATKQKIRTYCDKKKLLMCNTYDGIVLIKCKNEKAKELLESANREQMDGLMKFMMDHPQNKDATIIQQGTLGEILDYVS